MDTSDRVVKIGIIGAGGIAGAHVTNYRKIPWVEIVAVADVIPGKALAFARKWNIPEDRVFEEHREMIEKVEMDAVSVCTHNMQHREPTVDALEAGKHVMVEKPMAATLEDAKAMMRACDASGKILMVGFQTHFSAEYKAAKQVVESGTLGRIYYAESVYHRRWGIAPGLFLKKEFGGVGAMADIGCYALHTTMSLMGDPKPLTVSAITADYLAKGVQGVGKTWGTTWQPEDVEVEEFAAAFVRFENGAVMVSKVSWAANVDSMGRPFFLGTKGGMALEPLEVYVNQQIGDMNMTATPKGLPGSDEWVGKVTSFATAVRDGLPSPIDPHGVYLTNVVMDGVLRSARLGYEVKVDCSY